MSSLELLRAKQQQAASCSIVGCNRKRAPSETICRTHLNIRRDSTMTVSKELVISTNNGARVMPKRHEAAIMTKKQASRIRAGMNELGPRIKPSTATLNWQQCAGRGTRWRIGE